MDPIADMPAGLVTKSQKVVRCQFARAAVARCHSAEFPGRRLPDAPLVPRRPSLERVDETGGIERAVICAAYPEVDIERTPNGWVHAVRTNQYRGRVS